MVGVILTNVVGFFLAYLLTKPLKTTEYAPDHFFHAECDRGLLLGFIWQFIFIKGFATMGDLTGLSFFNLPWLGDATTGFWAIVMVFIWQSSGYLMVIYIASLDQRLH